MADAVNDLIRERGALRRSLRSAQELKMHGQTHLVSQADLHLGPSSELRGDICELQRLGATAKFRGPSPESFRVRGLPRNHAEQDFMLTKLWQYVGDGEMFIFTPNAVSEEGEYSRSPSTTVAKKLTGGTISSDKRLIWGGRRFNPRCPKSDYWPPITPSIEDRSIRFCQLRAAYHDIPILGKKRDIDSAFTRRRMHPDSVVMFGAECQLSSDPDDVVIFFYLVLPFGFTGSPGIFGRLMQGVQL